MKLIVFDIDGTVLDSVQADDHCFIQTFNDLHGIDLTDADWNDFTHVTDSGLTMEIFEKWFHRAPITEELAGIKAHFKKQLQEYTNQFKEVENALNFIELILQRADFEIGFATGGWKETAELKCNSVGLDLQQFIFKSSNDHFDRSCITALAIEEAKRKAGTMQFESVTYFGDGIWDYKTTQSMGIEFIGVDFKNNGKLKAVGAEKVIENFVDEERIINWI